MFGFFKYKSPRARKSASVTPRVEVLEDRSLPSVTILEYPTTTSSSSPLGIVAGKDGNVWFTESSSNQIAMIAPGSQVVNEYPIPTANSTPAEITVDLNGNLWFTENSANQIGEFNPNTHAFSAYPIPSAASQPFGITMSPDGNIWFTEVADNQIGEINPTTHTITEYPIPTGGSTPAEIVATADGNLWFTENNANQIGEVNAATHTITEYAIPTSGSQPFGITVGPNGNPWFTESNTNRIGEINVISHGMSEFLIPTGNSQPIGITTGTDGNLWFTESNTSKIGELNMTTYAITDTSTPTNNSSPADITSVPGGNLWFTESGVSQAGTALIPPSATTNPTSESIGAGQSITFTAAAGTTSSLVQWEVSTNGGSTFAYLTNTGVYSGVTTNTLSISGATTSMSGYEYRALFSNGAVSTAAILTVVSTFSVTPSLPSGFINTNYNQTINVSGNNTPFTTFTISKWNAGTTGLTATALTISPATGTITINGTPTGAGTATFTVLAGTSASDVLTANFSIAINLPLSITASLPPAMAMTKYTQTITASGGTAPYATFSINGFSAGTTGLTLSQFIVNATAGTITINGTPTAAGTASFTVDVIDSVGSILSKAYTITVIPALAVTSPPQGTANANYNRTLTVSGGALPYTTFAVSGFNAGTTGLTAGEITTNQPASTIVINGTPSAAGTASFSFTAIDSDGFTLTKTFSITINPAPTVGNPTLPQWDVNKTGFTGALKITGGTAPFIITSATGLPTGLIPVVSGNMILLTGTPTVANSFPGGSITLQDAAGATVTQTMSLTINPAPTVGSLTHAQWDVTNAGFTGTMTIAGGTGPFLITSYSGLPNGLTPKLSGQTISFTGTPTVAKTFASGSITLKDETGTSVTKTFSITINGGLSVTSALPQGTANTNFDRTIVVSGGTQAYTTLAVTGFSAGTTGLTASEITSNAVGTITIDGTPTGVGTAVFTVHVADSGGSTLTKSYSVTINPPLSIANLTQTQWTADESNYAGLMSIIGGSGPFTITHTAGLPTGVSASLSGGRILLTGTPTVAGTFSSGSVTLRDSAGATFTKTFSITVNPALSLPSSLPQGTDNVNYDHSITISGGTGPYTMVSVPSYNPGTTGLTPSPFRAFTATGTLSINGTPTAPGTMTFLLKVEDSVGAVLTKTYTVTINAPPKLGSLTLTQWTEGKSGFSGTIAITNGTAPFTVTSSSGLPTGMTATVSGSTIHFSGTPSAAHAFGSGSVTIRDASGVSVTESFGITINPPLVITTTSLPAFASGVSYSTTVATTGGTGTVTFAVTTGSLPTGLKLGSNGKITGSSTAKSSFTFTITATDAIGAKFSKQFTL